MKLYHTYAHVGQFADYLRDNGATDLGPNPSWLKHLEGSSRRIDGYCARSRFGSGFGPRIGTNRYDGTDERCLYLDDDLLAIGTVTTTTQTVGGGTTTLTDETHFIKGPYDTAPYRELILAATSSAVWGFTDRSNSVSASTWGYSNETAALGTIVLASGSATAGTMTAGTAYAGMTLSVGAEQIYVSATAGSAVGGTVLTLVRGVNGTSGTATGTASASVYVYPDEVTQTALQIAMRRWKGRNAGVTGQYGGGQIPVTGNQDSERSILNGGVHHLRIYSAG